MRVLLVDDEPLVRDGIASLLSSRGYEVIGQADDGEVGVELTRSLRPDLVLMDIRMRGMGGLEATRRIKAEMPEATVVMLTVSDDEQDLFDAIKAGAHGYLLKNIRAPELFEALDGIDAGEAPLSRRVAAKLLDEFRRLQPRQAIDEGEAVLTPRQQDVLQLVARGATNREIARALYITENTVKFHLKQILRTVHAQNRAALVAWAAERGIATSNGQPYSNG